MKLSVATIALLFATTEAFQVGPSGRASSRLNIVAGEEKASAKIEQIYASKPAEDPVFDELVKSSFPGAISNKELATRVVELLDEKGFTPDNTLLATSVCADELARVLEDEFVDIYGTNFNLGGLSGFPFAGNTGWGAMSAHVPDNGYCLTIHGPHVGITKDGVIGKVERSGIALVDNCCGSAIAASNYLKGITDGTGDINPRIQQFSDFQQGAVQELILPFGKRLERAEDRMRELPYALYDSQEVMVTDIVNTGKGGIKKGLAVLGGIQINTGPDTLDYFHPLRFDYFDEDGNLVENMLPYLR
eukprot:CAMPEP_0201865726 /NCGR_PEP_ID=MMETSP0902-20130614/530_1 /ASSEMBLY_ACC=CAM_ASM_000551 /TAXON_ID=420261 /ORGANISM="Thalassiosira antarctica, Strain CCMP982" /LENGTH=303 /DNA_ID=CAMNT_0048390555 /DNA_START=23 /DNA_END=934 /DNA_ORIENTATION=-